MANPQMDEVERVKAAYLERLRRALRRAPAAVREDALNEVGSHIEDEWRALREAGSHGEYGRSVRGGDLAALARVLERLGLPETYGRDLALQLLLQQGSGRRSPGRLMLAAFFWASTSLAGAVVVLSAAVVLGFGLGMVVVAIQNLRGRAVWLIEAIDFQVFRYQGAALRFPPQDWQPWLVALVGVLPALVVLAGLYRFYTRWVRSRLVRRGLEWLSDRPVEALPRGWERQAALATLGFAGLGLGNCLVFGLASGLAPVGRAETLSLPEDFFSSLPSVLAFGGCLVFLCAPALGLLFTARRRMKRET
jgi:hypothetical protein